MKKSRFTGTLSKNQCSTGMNFVRFVDKASPNKTELAKAMDLFFIHQGAILAKQLAYRKELDGLTKKRAEIECNIYRKEIDRLTRKLVKIERNIGVELK